MTTQAESMEKTRRIVALGMLQSATIPISSKTVWRTAVIPPAGLWNHGIVKQANCRRDEAFHQGDRAPRMMKGGRRRRLDWLCSVATLGSQMDPKERGAG